MTIQGCSTYYSDGVVEGYIDLLYRGEDGLVVVDYKTDTWRTEAELATKVERYRVQLATYAGATSEAAGEPVSRTLLLFLDSASRGREVSLAGS